jgi:hypothetical protein
MDVRLARLVLNATTQAVRELGGIPRLLDHASEEMREVLKMPVGRSIAEILIEIQDPIFERFPALKLEFEENLDRFGMTC